MIRYKITAFLVCLFLLGVGTLKAQSEIDFNRQIAPILKKHCAACHNEDDYDAGFSVDTYSDLEDGSDGEPVFVAGDPDESVMIQLMTGELEPLMPPDDQPRPTEAEIELLKKWIEQGAKDSPPEESGGAGSMDENEGPKNKAIIHASSPITSVAWSPKNVIAVARFQSVELLDGETLDSLKVLRHEGKVHSVKFSDDGNWLLSAGGQVGKKGEASLWKLDGFEQVLQISGHSDAIYSAVLSPNSELIATASYDKKIKLWNVDDGQLVDELKGHNDAVFDLEFSSDSKNLISASADQTVKVWGVDGGRRLDTLGQPLMGQLVTGFSPDNRYIVAGGQDNRIRVWQFLSRDKADTNPLLHSRFAHEDAIIALEFTPDGRHLISSSEDHSIKFWETSDFQQVATVEGQPDICSAIVASPDGKRIFVGRQDGTTALIDFPVGKIPANQSDLTSNENSTSTNLESAVNWNNLNEVEPNNRVQNATSISFPTRVQGVITSTDDVGDVDLFRFQATAGQTLIFETRARRDKSKLDSRIQILDSQGHPVPRVKLRAVRDSYFTFRGKDSNTSDDFRIHNWQEMDLNDYLYCNGEVVRLFHHPRGPDSGFMVYPGGGKRQGFFDTTPTSHALHEACYIVRPFPVETEFQPNGLPVFQLNYENDDGSDRRIGADSRLTFVAPSDGTYFAKVSDIRGFGGTNYKYRLEVREPRPDFNVSISNAAKIARGGGKEVLVKVTRDDGFEGPISVQVTGLPAGFQMKTPLLIEARHFTAYGTIYLDGNAPALADGAWEKIKVTASATVNGKLVEKAVKGFRPMEIGSSPKVEIRIVDVTTKAEDAFKTDIEKPMELVIHPGESIEAKVIARRIAHGTRISFGNADSGRNLPHGVYVDNIGLNGLMIIKGQNEQRFFLTAEEWVQPQVRLFHVRANDVEGEVSFPVRLRIVRE